MGNIKDLVDLATQLANSVKDRKMAGELNSIQALALQLQAEQSTLHEKNVELREENFALKQQNQELDTENVGLRQRNLFLEAENEDLKSAPVAGPSGDPICPNCSTRTKPFYMSPLEKDFVAITGQTHECPKCLYTTIVEGS